MTVWVTSDHHFGHNNILKYCGRIVFMTPDDARNYKKILASADKSSIRNALSNFHVSDESTKRMDRGLIADHNRVVREDDLVIHLGDFAFKRHEEYRKQMNGKFILLLGNHDKSASEMSRIGFIVVESPTLRYGNLIFSHEPMKEVPKGYINVHGHIHEKKTNGPRVNVSVDATNYLPVKIEELIPHDRRWTIS